MMFLGIVGATLTTLANAYFLVVVACVAVAMGSALWGHRVKHPKHAVVRTREAIGGFVVYELQRLAPKRPVSPADHLINDLRIDLEDLNDLCYSLQDRYGFKADSTEWKQAVTVAKFVDLVVRYAAPPNDLRLGR
jgi:acyl carrier protein